MSLINNTKYAILDDKGILTDKYILMITADVNAVPSLLEIQQENVGLIFWCNYQPLKIHVEGDMVKIQDENFYGEFSANNVVGFTNAITLLTSLKAGVTG